MNEVLAVLVAIIGGLAGGLVGVGGGVLFVPALTIFLGLSQVEGESTSLMMIVIVAFVGAYRQRGYGNLNLSDALWIGVLSPVGVCSRSAAARAKASIMLLRVEACSRCSGASQTICAPKASATISPVSCGKISHGTSTVVAKNSRSQCSR